MHINSFENENNFLLENIFKFIISINIIIKYCLCLLLSHEIIPNFKKPRIYIFV